MIAIVALCFFSACDSKRVFEEYRFVGNHGWHRDSAMVFSVPVRAPGSGYRMYLDVRNRGNYPNRNIWLSVAIHFPDGRQATDTVEVVLAEPGGRWRGHGIGDLFDLQVLYKQDLTFPVAGEYQVRVKQAMRPTVLKGIQDIGVRLEKENSRKQKWERTN